MRKFQGFHDSANDEVFVEKFGWSWFAFLAPPLWAVMNLLFGVFVVTSAILWTLLFLFAKGKLSAATAVTIWTACAWFVADYGFRWKIGQKLKNRSVSTVSLGIYLARSASEAEEKAKLSVQAERNFLEAARRAPVDHVRQAIDMLDRIE